MKLYRILPDAYSIDNQKIVTKRAPGNDLFFEAAYNKGGLTTLEQIINEGQGSNSIGQHLTEPSKYFYLFAEDAIECARIILPICKFARIVEYDIPEAIALQNIGLGDYHGNIVIETAVGISNFDGERLRYKNIKKDEHIEFILAHLKDTIDIYKHQSGKSFNISDEEIIKLFDTDYRIDILDDDINSDLTKSKFLTNGIYPFVNSYSSFEEMKDINVDYLKDKGLELDFSKEACEERKALLANLDLPDTFYVPISSFRGNDVVKKRVLEYIKK